MRGGRKQKRTRQGQLSWESRFLLCEPKVIPPAIAKPTKVKIPAALSAVAVSSLKNFSFCGNEGRDTSNIELCKVKGVNPPDADSADGDGDGGACPSGGEFNSVISGIGGGASCTSCNDA